MILVFDNFKIDNKELCTTIKEYINRNHCCDKFPNCTHPKYQSDSFVSRINDKNIKIIFDDYFNNIKKLLDKNFLNVLEHKAWAYLYPKNQENGLHWHTHLNENKHKVEVVNLSGLLYITPTTIGTYFKTKFINFEIVPDINRWFLWDSSILHSPKNVLCNEDRIVIATSTVLKK
jgi:hypothetical protein